MSGNTFGKLFTVTTAGESHGPALVAIVDGCPPGLELSLDDLQRDLDRRKPGTSRHTTQRQEPDEVEILSGVFEGRTTGCAIGLLIRNTDQKSKDYSAIKDLFRPAHADYTYHHKYGERDYRGGGRSSARETAMRVAAGAIAKKYLATQGIVIRGYMSQLGPIEIPFKTWDSVEDNAFFCPDPDKVPELEAYMDQLRRIGPYVNTAVFAGHSVIRTAVMGADGSAQVVVRLGSDGAAVTVKKGAVDVDPVRAESKDDMRLKAGVVAVYDSGVADDGHPYLAMEYLSAGSLGDRLQTGPLPWEEAVRVGVTVTSGGRHRGGHCHTNWTRRSFCISASPWPEASSEPLEITCMRSAGTPRFSRKVLTDWPRRSVSMMLYSSVPTASVWPSTITTASGGSSLMPSASVSAMSRPPGTRRQNSLSRASASARPIGSSTSTPPSAGA